MAQDARQKLLQFASHAAHDLAGPVDQISSLVALFVHRYRGKVDHEAEALLTHIESARSRLDLTAAGLRKCFQVSTTEGGHAPVDLNGAWLAALVPLGKEIAQSGGEVRAGDLPVVEGNRELLILLFQVLVENALKFRRPDVPPRVLASVNGPVLQVSDNGIGVDPQYREMVFEPFKKLNGHAYPGAGLGLTMARMIVEMHGGSIWLDSADEGTRVCFELPGNQP